MATYTKGSNTKLSEHFTSSEFDCKGAGCCKETIINPQLVEYLQAIRSHFNQPITITSGYRCSTHNTRVGGATGSRHSKGDAADIVVKNVSSREVAKYAESIGIKGIGLYETADDGYFTHIDTRTTKSFWYGQSEQARTTFGGTTSSSTTTSEPTELNSVSVNLPTLEKGAKNDYVEIAQIRLGIDSDGIFGSGTYNAVKQFQSKRNLPVTGKIDANTWKALFSQS